MCYTISGNKVRSELSNKRTVNGAEEKGTVFNGILVKL